MIPAADPGKTIGRTYLTIAGIAIGLQVVAAVLHLAHQVDERLEHVIQADNPVSLSALGGQFPLKTFDNR